MKKLAVIFPGIGYHTDKPLLYYSGKLVAGMGYEIIKIAYPPLEVNLKEAAPAQKGAFVKQCVETAAASLRETDLSGFSDILFISKSIGTVVAAYLAESLGTKVRHVFFTPLEETFGAAKAYCAIAFNGTKDNWADWEKVVALAGEKGVPITTVEGANHSLETGDAVADIRILGDTINSVKRFVE